VSVNIDANMETKRQDEGESSCRRFDKFHKDRRRAVTRVVTRTAKVMAENIVLIGVAALFVH
jgi:hypothetical protein